MAVVMRRPCVIMSLIGNHPYSYSSSSSSSSSKLAGYEGSVASLFHDSCFETCLEAGEANKVGQEVEVEEEEEEEEEAKEEGIYNASKHSSQ
ncbi:hypothetical protein E2C01_098685 [Portunus trituberculatus]|uniref:Uncharacterized protein n=1 Tax=Portunus trituberculatus TaxID=210409 RepID=A0A5B7K908_PORTR|nr:hypothetical protein [Portunus trituberculatus]